MSRVEVCRIPVDNERRWANDLRVTTTEACLVKFYLVPNNASRGVVK